MPLNPEPDPAKTEKLRPFSPIEGVVAFGLFLTGIALLDHAADLAFQGGVFTVMEHAGVALILFYGCFDPINFLWLFFPFTSSPVKEPRHSSARVRSLFGGGVLFLIIGWVCKHWWR